MYENIFLLIKSKNKTNKELQTNKRSLVRSIFALRIYLKFKFIEIKLDCKNF